METGLLEVQKSLLQMRMIKVETLFSRIEPMVKSLSRDTGKPVKLTFRGAIWNWSGTSWAAFRNPSFT
jgi:chemotaxis protein histidine kinase CheA